MHSDALARIRRFNRAVTAEVGALDASFLGRGRPLGEARLLHAIGHEGRDLAEARAALGLDSGLASRLLRALEGEGLVEVLRHPKDGRRRVARPTDKGRAELRAYDRLSDKRAKGLFARQGRAAADLLEAMDRVACALNRERIEIRPVDPGAEPARRCLNAYYEELARRFAQGFEVGLSRDPEARLMRPPHGAFLVAFCDGLPVACGALKGPSKPGEAAEVKRVWVADAARGIGLASRLMAEIEEAARGLGFDRLRLDTNSALHEAVSLYRRLGWREIPRFNDDPYPDVFFEKRLSGASAAADDDAEAAPAP